MEREKIIFLQSVAQFLSRESIVVGVMRKNRDATPRFVFVTTFVDHLLVQSLRSIRYISHFGRKDLNIRNLIN